MRDSSRNESPRSLDQQGRGAGQDNNGAENPTIFVPLYPWLYARLAGDDEWFNRFPDITYRMRETLPGESSSSTHVIITRSGDRWLQRWLLPPVVSTTLLNQIMAVVMDDPEGDNLVTYICRVIDSCEAYESEAELKKALLRYKPPRVRRVQ